MRVLIVHERYRQRGGEDVVVEGETELLARYGVETDLLTADNAAIDGGGSLGLAVGALWSRSGYSSTRAAIARFRPDIVHVHNSFPLLSASVFDAARSMGVPVVQTLHNYRLLCPNALLLRDGAPCEACVGQTSKWSGLRHGCYRGSRAATAAVAGYALSQRLGGVHRRGVAVYHALTPFAAGLFARGGIPADRIAVRPPLLDYPSARGGAAVGHPAGGPPRAGALFVGRLSPEKGLDTLLSAWRGVDAPLDIIGDGPDMDRLRGMAPPQVRFLGHKPAAIAAQAMARAALLVFPSLCYENFPLVVAEAMAAGLPALCAGGGAAADVLGEAGDPRLFARPGDAEDWRRKAVALLADPDALASLGAGERDSWERRLAPDAAFAATLALYRRALRGLSLSPVPGQDGRG
ncbi:glycosyltransferase [Azospirillum sp. 11R-A]|uniref:glycosyltransferase n=1 Tax=Azospirillum sp. 11R-A TaxID=3111634 RepID=UPI003C222E3C